MCLALFGCAADDLVLSGTTETRVLSGDSDIVKVRVLQPWNYSSRIHEELKKARELAINWCRGYGKKPLPVLGNKSVFKDLTYQCVDDPKQVREEKTPETVDLTTYEKKCRLIGFKPNTDKFADCILRLMEMASGSKKRNVIQNNNSNNSAIRSLLEEEKRQRQLEGSIELMRRGLEMACTQLPP